MAMFYLRGSIPIILLIVCLSSTLVESYEVSIWFETVCDCSYTGHEQAGAIQVCAEIAFINGTMDTVRDYNITVSTDNSSASASSTDYFLPPTVVTFPVGSLISDLQCVNISITDDEIAESTEIFHVELSTDDADVDLHSICTRASVTITDSDAITLELLETSRNVSESVGSLQICVNVTHGSVEGNVFAFYSTQDGTASANQDFSYIRTRTLSFPPGDMVGTVRCISVSVIDDNRVESDEVDQFFTLVLRNGQKTVVTQGNTRINIRDNDVATIAMLRGTMSVTEQFTSISVCAVLGDWILEIPLSFVMTSFPNTATENVPADYIPLNQTATFGVGSRINTRVCQSVTIAEDDILEYNEDFSVVLSEESDKLVIGPGRDVTVITILEDGDTVEIGFESLNYTVTENDTTQVCAQIFRFSLEREVVAYLSTVDGSGTATAGSDYTSITSMGITFVSGQSASSNTTQCTQLSNILDDDILEYDEHFTMTLSSQSTMVVILTTSRDVANVTLREDSIDHVEIGFLPTVTFTGTEGVDGTVSVCPQILNGTLERNVSVFATTFDVSAIDSIDYNNVSNGEIVFVPGQTVGGMQCIPVTILDDDNILEYSEYFQMTVSSSSSIVITPSGLDTVDINITEDPQDGMTAGFQQTSYVTVETGGSLQVCAEIFVGNLQRNVTLTVAPSNGSAIAPGDYSSFSTQVTFTVGQRASDNGSLACTQIEVVNDNVVEMNEESLSLSLSPDEPAFTNLAASTATVIIRENDNDVPGSVVLSSSTYDAYESDRSVEVCAVVQADALERTIIVQLGSQDVTARNVEDYTSFQFEPITFISGDIFGTQRCYNVTINDDGILEGNETFSVTLSSREDIGMTQAIVTIRPDPADSVELGFLEDGYSISEQESLRDEMICVTINSGMLEIDITVDLVVQDITAQAGADYTGPFPLVLTFSSGQTVREQRCASVSALDDSLIEDDETLNITLSSPLSDSGAVRFTAGDETETLTILQDPNDRAVFQLVNTTGSGLEGDDIIVCSELVNNGGGLSRPISLIMMIVNGSANSGVDFNGTTSYPLTFPPNSNNGDIQCISISLFTDMLFEVPENFVVELTTLDPAVMVTQDANIAVFTIIDVPDPNVIVVGFSNMSYEVREGTDAVVSVCITIFLGTAGRNITVLLFTPISGSAITAAPGLDFTPIAETLTFTEGQTMNDSVCADISIVDDVFVEMMELFEVQLLPNPQDLLQPAVIMADRNRTLVSISDEEDNSDVTVQPSAPNVVGVEGNETSDSSNRETRVIICIELARGNLLRNITVNVHTISSTTSTATANEDYIPLNQNVTFTSGQNATGDNQQCVFITLIDDDILEGTEIFVIIITALDDDSVVNVTDDVITVTIEEDPNDFVEVDLLPGSTNVTENVTFPVCLEITNGTLGRNITVPLIVESGSATEGVDFERPEPSSLMFTSGQSTGDVQCGDVTILGDPVPQGERNFTIRIGDGSDGGGGGRGVRLDLILPYISINIDDIVQVALLETVYTVTEDPTAQVNVCVSIELGTLRNDATVALVTPFGESITATPAFDFTPISEVLTFTAGLSRGDSVCAPIMIIEDVFVESPETFEVVLLPTLQDFHKVFVIAGRDRATVVILDGENRNLVIRPTMLEIVATESDGTDQPDSDGSRANIVRGCIELVVGNLQQNIAISVMTLTAPYSPGVATVFEDYLPLNVNVTFTSGQSASGDNEQCFNVTLLDDTVLEGNERFEILIAPLPEDADIVNITNQIITIVIEEDTEDNVTIGLTRSTSRSFTVTESVDTAIMVCAELQEGTLERNVTIHFVDNGASNVIAGVDFRIVPPSVTFTAGQFGFDGIERCATIEILDDNDTENIEVFDVILRPEEADVGTVFISPTNNMITVNIMEDPDDAVQFSPSPSYSVVAVIEGNDALVCIGVSLGSLQREILVTLKTISGERTSATPGEDFVDVVTTIVVSSNEPVCTNITILNDDILEDCEAFFVGFEVVTSFSGIAVVPRDSDKAIVIIEDDLLDVATVGFDQSALEITEGDTNNETEVCVIASNVMERSVTVYLQIDNINSDATPGVDYQEVKPKELVFDRDVTSICTPVYVLDDNLLEATQNILFTLTPSLKDISVVNFALQQASVQIYEDAIDEGSVGLTQDMYTVQENEGSVQVCAELLSGVLGSTLSFPVEVDQELHNSATKNVDYTGLPNNIVFESGQTTGARSCINITIINDNLKEQKESLNIFLTSSLSGVQLVSTKSTIEIIDTSGEEVCVAIIIPLAILLLILLIIVVMMLIFYLVKRRNKRRKVGTTATLLTYGNKNTFETAMDTRMQVEMPAQPTNSNVISLNRTSS